MSEFTDYLFEEIVANIREELYDNYSPGVSEDAYIIERLHQVAKYIVKESRDAL
jgi:hypothetical protein